MSHMEEDCREYVEETGYSLREAAEDWADLNGPLTDIQRKVLNDFLNDVEKAVMS